MTYLPPLPEGYTAATLWLTPLNAVTAVCVGKPDLVLVGTAWLTREEASRVED